MRNDTTELRAHALEQLPIVNTGCARGDVACGGIERIARTSASTGSGIGDEGDCRANAHAYHQTSCCHCEPPKVGHLKVAPTHYGRVGMDAYGAPCQHS
jgi:hypothetical protein